jgi:hypothetical protein
MHTLMATQSEARFHRFGAGGSLRGHGQGLACEHLDEPAAIGRRRVHVLHGLELSGGGACGVLHDRCGGLLPDQSARRARGQGRGTSYAQIDEASLLDAPIDI